MADRLYSYRDVLPEELDEAWLRTRDTDEVDEPELVLVGVGREAVVVTETRIYRLSAGILPFGESGERVAVRALADLAEARVREGFFLCRLSLLFATGEEMQLRVRNGDRDKMRVAARMLSTLSLHAQDIARDEAMARQTRAQAEAAAGRLERVPGRALPLRAAAADSQPPPAAAMGMASGGDAVELLKGLWHLVEVGALTSAEYQSKKADLLARL
jgi:hypothetical protein